MSEQAPTEPDVPAHLWLWLTNVAQPHAETALRQYRKLSQSHHFAAGKPRRTLHHTVAELEVRGIVGIYGRADTAAGKAVASG